MPKNNQPKILVTGGAGFIGGNIVRLLIQKGYQVVILDNLSTGSKKGILEQAIFIKGDLRQRKDIKKALVGVSAVIHTAALISVPDSFAQPEEYFNVNVLGTVNLLEEMCEAGVKKIVFSSTAAVYDPAGKMPLTEDSLKKPYSPYGSSKLAMEEVIHYYHLAYGFDAVIFRYFNAYGPGDYKKNPNNVVPKFFKLCLNNQVLPIHGDGSMVRDYVYVEDLAKAHLKGLAIKGFKVYNLGSGKGQTIDTLIQQISKSSGINCRVKHQKIPLGYPQKMLADISKAKNELGWKPVTNLEEGITLTAQFFKS